MRLARDFSPEQLEAAAERALTIGAFSYKNLRALIQAVPSPPVVAAAIPVPHEHLRGADYYQ